MGLLKTGYYTIEEVAFQSGFNDPAYFTQLYKKKTGFLPSEKLKKARRRSATKKWFFKKNNKNSPSGHPKGEFLILHHLLKHNFIGDKRDKFAIGRFFTT